MNALLTIRSLCSSSVFASSSSISLRSALLSYTCSRTSAALQLCQCPATLSKRTIHHLSGLSHAFPSAGVGEPFLRSMRMLTDAPQSILEGEQRLVRKLKQRFPKATDVQVHDISGGCGSMYEIYVVAEEFRGLRTVLQHRLVNETLKAEIKDMHGLRISTAVPS